MTWTTYDSGESSEACSPDSSEDSVPPLSHDHKEFTFRSEIEAYRRLSDTSICPRFYSILACSRDREVNKAILSYQLMLTIIL